MSDPTTAAPVEPVEAPESGLPEIPHPATHALPQEARPSQAPVAQGGFTDEEIPHPEHPLPYTGTSPFGEAPSADAAPAEIDGTGVNGRVPADPGAEPTAGDSVTEPAPTGEPVTEVVDPGTLQESTGAADEGTTPPAATELPEEHAAALAAAGATAEETSAVSAVEGIKERLSAALAEGETAIVAELEKLRSELGLSAPTE